MGVDCSCIVAYGDFLEDIEIIEDESKDDKLFFIDELNRLCYDYEVADNNGYKIVVEPYSMSWIFIGVSFLEGTPEETIEALKVVKEKWEKLIKELKEVVKDNEFFKEKVNNLKPSIVEEPYYS